MLQYERNKMEIRTPSLLFLLLKLIQGHCEHYCEYSENENVEIFTWNAIFQDSHHPFSLVVMPNDSTFGYADRFIR